MIPEITAKYQFTLLVIDCYDGKTKLHDILPIMNTFPGYHKVDYSKLTLLRVKETSEDLRYFLNRVPLTIVTNQKRLGKERIRVGFSFLAEVFNSRVKYLALEKFFELYSRNRFKEAYELAEIMMDKHPEREFVKYLLNAARTSYDYYDNHEISSDTLTDIIDGINTNGLYAEREGILMTRKEFRAGNYELAQHIFESLLENNDSLKSENILNTLLWTLEKFEYATKYKNKTAEYLTFLHSIEFLYSVEPLLIRSNIEFSELRITDINWTAFNIKLGADLAIISNVTAYYFSYINDYKTAARLYACASCFLTGRPETRIITLNNLMSCYRKLDQPIKESLVKKK